MEILIDWMPEKALTPCLAVQTAAQHVQVTGTAVFLRGRRPSDE